MYLFCVASDNGKEETLVRCPLYNNNQFTHVTLRTKTNERTSERTNNPISEFF